MFRATFLVFFLLFGAVFSHPHKEPDAESIRAHEEVRRRCGPRVAKMKRDRLALRRRDDSVDADSGDTVYKINAKAPKYNKIKDWTNILTPETSRGPYFLPRSQTLRQDIREDEPGVPLSLEIGVIDIDTCDPLDSVLVDIWLELLKHCNATGSYSSFTGLSPNTQFLDLYSEQTGNGTLDLHQGLPDLSWLSTDESTFLRGMWPTDKHGVTSFTTIVPGFYVQRAIHIHVQIHTNWTILSNGTLAHGAIVSTGQIFIDELLSRQLMALEPYVSHTEIERVKNADDGIYNQESATGAMTLLDTEPLDGKDYTKGVFGYITLGVQMSQIRNGSTIDALPEVPVPA
ncbi:INTRADIOL-DIOXYGENAS domain-containing protein [Fusarium falciforme]|uniref:INTRADIOL-DIOXYGENAS domain-containing protein n=1 Tax=Fusarium falciforme TaxID=195108 RepID=UPI0023008110|nr:INTRADIOL-DIOXYGENAS domain-containing protein [Fusarium falciforme]WAO86449.1 INTRADIOL-DIOXYGENAS domain-containing protein [Fusarium falciforme]